jgi:hypothetical protein
MKRKTFQVHTPTGVLHPATSKRLATKNQKKHGGEIAVFKNGINVNWPEPFIGQG